MSATAPHFGSRKESPASQPDSSTHGQPAVRGEASGSVSGASSPAFFSEGRNVRDEESGQIFPEDEKNKQAEACSTGVIHFDSVDSELEAAILRHVAQLAAAPVMVDRPGGVVHSERELRIVLPATGDARADEAAAVAVEFGVLRGLLDLTRRPSRAELSAGAVGVDSGKGGKLGGARGGKSKWWILGAALVAVALAVFGAALDASTSAVGIADAKGAMAEARATGSSPSRNSSWGNSGAGFSLRGLAQPVARRAAMASAGSVTPVAFSAAAEPQGQFATGQAGTNSADPCQAQTKSFVSINQTANTQLAAWNGVEENLCLLDSRGGGGGDQRGAGRGNWNGLRHRHGGCERVWRRDRGDGVDILWPTEASLWETVERPWAPRGPARTISACLIPDPGRYRAASAMWCSRASCRTGLSLSVLRGRRENQKQTG